MVGTITKTLTLEDLARRYEKEGRISMSDAVAFDVDGEPWEIRLSDDDRGACLETERVVLVPSALRDMGLMMEITRGVARAFIPKGRGPFDSFDMDEDDVCDFVARFGKRIADVALSATLHFTIYGRR